MVILNLFVVVLSIIEGLVRRFIEGFTRKTKNHLVKLFILYCSRFYDCVGVFHRFVGVLLSS